MRQAIRPSSNAADFQKRNGLPVLYFDTTTAENVYFLLLMPRNYAGGGVTVYLHTVAKTLTSGTLQWSVYFDRIGTSLDIDGNSYASAQDTTSDSVSGTSGIVTIQSVAFTNGAQMDSVAVGELFFLKVERKVSGDNLAEDGGILGIEIKET
jgi:hypothetical protein